MATLYAPSPSGGDDQSVIQGLMNSAAAGDTIIFKAGAVYRHSGKILLQNKANVTIKAENDLPFTWIATNPRYAALHIWTNSNNCHVVKLNHRVQGASTRIDIGFDVAPFVVDSNSGVWLEDCISDGSAGLGIYVFRGHQGKYDRFQVLNTGADGFHMTWGSSYNTLTDYYGYNLGDDGVANIGYIQDGEAGRPHHNVVIRPRILKSHARAISFAGAYDCSVVDPQVNESRATGILFARENGQDFKTSNTERCFVTGGNIRKTQTPKAALGQSNADGAVHSGFVLFDNGISGGLTGCYVNGVSVGDFGTGSSAVAQAVGSATSGCYINNINMYAGTPNTLWSGTAVPYSGWNNLRSTTMQASPTDPVTSGSSGGGTTTPETPAVQPTITATLSNVTGTTATLNWTVSNAGTASITGWINGRDGVDAGGGGVYSTVDIPSVMSRTFLNLVPGTTYNLSVKAKTSSGESNSITLPAKTLTTTETPTNPSTGGNTGGSTGGTSDRSIVDPFWIRGTGGIKQRIVGRFNIADIVANATGTTIARNVTAVASNGSITMGWAAPTNTTNLTGYLIGRDGVDSTGFGVYTTTVGVGTTGVVFDRLINNNSYNVFVEPVYSANFTPVRTTKSAIPFSSGTADTTRPSNVTGFFAQRTSTTQVTMSWNAATDNVGISGYNIYRGVVGGAITLVATLGNVLNYVDSGLTPGGDYIHHVRARDTAGNLSLEPAIFSSGTTPSGTTPTTVPTISATVTNVTANTIAFNWTASGGTAAITGWDNGRNGFDAGGGGTYTTIDSPSTTGRTFLNLLPGTQYEIYVQGLTENGPTNKVVLTPTTTGTTTTPTNPTPATGNSGARSRLPWSSGAFLAQDGNNVVPFENYRGRKLDFVDVHPTRDTASSLLQDWWITGTGAQPILADGGNLSIAFPMWANNQNAGTDTSSLFSGLGTVLTNRGFSRPIIRLGWEMNLPGWGHHINTSNYNQWVSTFKRAVTQIRSKCPGAQIAFNPNEGGTQTGVNMRTLADALIDYIDYVGPDYYNWYSSVNSDSEWNARYNGNFGMKYWEDYARSTGKGFCVPEWGGYPGASDRGSSVYTGDSSLYGRKMIGRFAALASEGIKVHESYFNEPDGYIANSIWNPNQMPALSTAYKNSLALY